MKRFLFALPLVFANTVWPQAADYANSGYKTEEARARLAGSLVAHDREQTQRPRDLVKQIGLQTGSTVADIGTGAGFMLPYLSEAVGPSGRVLAEDIFPDFLERARKTAAEKDVHNATFILGNNRSVQLPAGAVDIVLILDAYHHFDYPKEMLASIRSGMKADGRLAIVEFYQRGFRDPKHIRVDEKDLIREVESNGFKLLSSKPFQADRQYLAIFAKEPK